MKVSIKKALEYSANNPPKDPDVDPPVDRPVWLMVGQALFQIANNPNLKVRGGLNRATRAQRLILNRMVGTRRNGSLPVTKTVDGLVFHDLTQGALDG